MWYLTVSILARAEARALLVIHLRLIGEICFNPRPRRGAGATSLVRRTRCNSSCFNPRPRRGAGATSKARPIGTRAYSTETGRSVHGKLDSRSVATRGLFFTPDLWV